MCAEYGGIHFELLQSIETADHLCEQIIRNAWELNGVEQYYHWAESRLGACRPAISCTFATVCVTISCMEDLPEPVYQLAHDMRGLIIGEGNDLYDTLRQAAYRHEIALSADTYDLPPPKPDTLIYIEQLEQTNAHLTHELNNCKHQLKMKEEKQQQIVNHYHGPYIAENHVHEGGNQILSAENVYLPGTDKVTIGSADDTTPPAADAPSPYFCLISEEAHKSGKAPVVEEELRCACISAPKLTKTILTNEALGYLNSKHLPSVRLYELLNEHYHLPFKEHNFTKYRSKTR